MSANNVGEVFATGPSFTNDRRYFEPLRMDMEWWDLVHGEQLHSFSSWNPSGTGVSNYVPVLDASVTPPGTGQHGSFYFRIWDTDKVIDKQTVRKKGVVVLKVKKYQNDPYVNLMYGFITKVRPQMHKNQLYYTITGAGSGIMLNERYVNLRRSARMKSIDSDIPMFDDELMSINKLYKELLTNNDIYVADDIPISKQTTPEMDTSTLDNTLVNDTILSLNEPYVQVSHTLNAMLDSIGADGGLDTYNRPYLSFPLSRIPQIILKRWDDDSDAGIDRADNVSYFMDDWDFEYDWSQESGFANRIFAKSRVTQGTSTASTSGTYAGFETLQDRDLAQKIPASPAKFRDLAVIVTRVEDGTSDPVKIKTLHGHIVQDINNTPTGPIVALFDIPLSTIPDDNPTAMFLSGLSIKRTVDPSSAHWIILYDRGTPSRPDTVNWYYNTDDNLTGTIARRQTIPGTPWSADHNNNSGWEITSQNSYNFAFSVLDSFTHIIVSEDVDSQIRYGIVEDLIDLSWASNTIAATKALGEIVAVRSLPKVSYATRSVTIPGKLFMPGMIVKIEDRVPDLTSREGTMAEVSGVTYNFGGSGSEAGNLGATTCDISLVGHYDFKLEEEAFGTGTE